VTPDAETYALLLSAALDAGDLPLGLEAAQAAAAAGLPLDVALLAGLRQVPDATVPPPPPPTPGPTSISPHLALPRLILSQSRLITSRLVYCPGPRQSCAALGVAPAAGPGADELWRANTRLLEAAVRAHL
jgi:hypothetical protein